MVEGAKHRGHYLMIHQKLLISFLCGITANFCVQANLAAQSIKLRITVENTAPLGGIAWSPLWFGFHDGTFDTYDLNQPASSAIELIAEEGIGLRSIDSPPGTTNVGSTLSDDLLSSNSGQIFGEIVGVQGINRPTDLLGARDFFPQEKNSVIVQLDNSSPLNRYFSYASMLVPSNDGFFANDNPLEHQIFDTNGNFIPTVINIFGAEILDAGTEINDEFPDTTPGLNQHVLFVGTEEGGVITTHPGYLPGGPILTQFSQRYSQPNFLTYQVARISISNEPIPIPESNHNLGLLIWGLCGISLTLTKKL